MDTRDLDAFEKLVYLALKGVGNIRKIMRERERESTSHHITLRYNKTSVVT